MKSPDIDDKSASLDVFDTKADSTKDEQSKGKEEPKGEVKPEEPQDPPFVSQDLPDIPITYATTEDDPQLDDASGGQELTFGSDPDEPELHDASGGQEITATPTDETGEDGTDGSSDDPFANIFVAADPGPDFGELQWAEDEPTFNYPTDEDDDDEDEDGED